MRLADNAKIALKKKASAFFFFVNAFEAVLSVDRVRSENVSRLSRRG